MRASRRDHEEEESVPAIEVRGLEPRGVQDGEDQHGVQREKDAEADTVTLPSDEEFEPGAGRHAQRP
jgi:hypothetical protein